MMYDLLRSLLSQDAKSFFKDKSDFTTYEIISALSKLQEPHEILASKAESLLIRAQAREPMNFDLEAEYLFMEAMHA